MTALQLIPKPVSHHDRAQAADDLERLRDLVDRAQQGDVVAFEHLIESHQQMVYAFALGFAHDEDQAKDLAQEALVKAYRAIGSFRFQASFGTWLYAIVRNLFRDQLRGRAAIETARGRPLGASDLQLPSDEAPAEEQLIAEESRQAVLSALRAVPDPYREVLFLADVQGQGYQEIASSLSVALGTVKSRVNRGREALRALLFEGQQKKETIR